MEYSQNYCFKVLAIHFIICDILESVLVHWFFSSRWVLYSCFYAYLVIFYWMLDIVMETAIAPYSSTLAWKIPLTEEPSGLQSMGSQRVDHDWATALSLFTLMHWRRKWQPTPVFLPGKSHWQRSLAGYSPWGRRKVGHDLATKQHTSYILKDHIYNMNNNNHCSTSFIAML